MEQIREYLKDTGFLQAHLVVNSTDFENLILKPSQDRLELIQWCLSEIDESLQAKLLHIVRDDELKKELLILTRKLGLSSEYDRDTVLGLGEQESQIAFWLKLLQTVKCVQHMNKLPAEQEFKTLSNTTSNVWCELLQSSNYKKSSSTKMTLIPIEVKIGAQQQKIGSLTSSIVKDKDLLRQQLQALKEESEDILKMNNNHSINISVADMKADAENVKDLSAKFNLLYKDEITSQLPQLAPLTHSQEANALQNTIPNVFGQLNTFTQTVCFAEMVVNGFATAVKHKDNSNYGNQENLGNEMFHCCKLLEKK